MTTVTESIWIDAEPWLVYDLIADVSAVGEHSPEATGAFGASRWPAVGERFWGRNRRGPVVWVTQCRVTAARRGSEFGFDVGVGPVPLSHWSYRLEPGEGGAGCVVTQSWTDRRDGLRGALATRIGSLLIPGPRDEHNRRNMRASLAGLKRRAEAA